jgi:hypothetical protein
MRGVIGVIGCLMLECVLSPWQGLTSKTPEAACRSLVRSANASQDARRLQGFFLLGKSVNKKQRKEAANALFDKYKIGDVLSTEDTKAMNGFVGQDHFGYKLARNERYPGAKGHHVLVPAIDGWYAWSWVRAISGYNPIDNIKKAMRDEVHHVGQSFMFVAAKCCVKCAAVEDLQADHRDIPFSVLARDWLGTQFLYPELARGPSDVGWVFKDPAALADWLKFHNERATYQVLCGSCNASKGAK